MSPRAIKLTAVVALLILAAPLTVEAQQAGQVVQTVGVLTPQLWNNRRGTRPSLKRCVCSATRRARICECYCDRQTASWIVFQG